MARTWWRKWVDRPAQKLSRQSSFQPGLEFLEERSLLAAGALDPTFGTAGAVGANVPPPTTGHITCTSAAAVVLERDAQILVAGTQSIAFGPSSFFLARYDASGNLTGSTTTRFGNNSATSATAIALQADGKILVAGTTSITAPAADATFAVARYNPDLTLDSSFGTSGLVTTDFTSGVDGANSIVVQPDGKIVVTGTASGNTSQVAVARYNPDGSLDSSFGTGGKVTTLVGSGATATAVALLSDGRIVVQGDAFSAGHQDVALVRYSANGSLDPSFGTSGTVISDLGAASAFGLVVQADGKLVIAGSTASASSSNFDFLVARYNANGSLDPSFGTNGQATADFGGPDNAHGVALQADGKIVVAGTAFGVGSNLFGGDSNFAVARFNTDGSLDTGFGTGGKVTTNFGFSLDAANGVTVQKDGKIVVVGGSSNVVALARYHGDNTPSGSPSQRFVSQVYQDLLKRVADAAGFNYFTTILDQGLATRSQVTLAILGSTEYRARVVCDAYRRFLGRDADPDGLNTFVNLLASGGTLEQVEAVLLGSPEYLNRVGGTNDAFLTALYRDVLGRPIDPSGSSGYTFALGHGSSLADVAGAVLTSGEADVLRVQGYYQSFLHRPADYNGTVDFEDALLGGARDEALIMTIVGSDEYFARL
jgi:uncharacterized delta-60 repeat protein